MDRFDSFDLRASQRHLFGALGDLESDVRITPLTSTRLVQIRVRPRRPGAHLRAIHVELMRRYSDALAGLSRSPRRNGGVRHRTWPWTRLRSSHRGSVPQADGKAQLVERIQVSSFGERSAVLRDVMGDTQNPAWDYVDRSAAIAAIDRFADLHPWERVEPSGPQPRRSGAGKTWASDSVSLRGPDAEDVHRSPMEHL